MTKEIKQNGKKGLAKWTTRDLLVTAAISVVFAVVLLGVNYLFFMFLWPLGPLGLPASVGIWFMPLILIAYILRRPGAALIAQMMISIISAPFSPGSWAILLMIIVAGVPMELVFFAARYRNYRLYILMIAGIVPGLVYTSLRWIPVGTNLLTIEMQIAIIAITIISGALGGCLAKIIADAIAKTGVLSNYAVGEEHQEEI